MKVLMIARSTLFTTPGGDTTQIKMTAMELISLGVAVDIRLTNEVIDYSHYRLIHFFNIIRPSDILPHISKSKLPYVVSPIFVDYSEYEKQCRKGFLKLFARILNENQLEYLKAVARFLLNGQSIGSFSYIVNGHRSSIEKIVRGASMLLPNSFSENVRFSKKYDVGFNYRKIVNAVDLSTFNENVMPNKKFEGHVLCVGRIEGIKNQLNLIKALSNTEINLTIIGKPSPNHMAYFSACKELALQAPNIQIIEHVEHSDLAEIYKAAKVHVLPSWFETTGLSSLEAAVMDCNIVITRKGDTEEYFNDHAFYCEPDDINSIRQAVIEAYQRPVEPALRNFIRENYNWETTAKHTLDAYQRVLN